MTSHPQTSADDGGERVVLLDESGRAIGTAAKHAVHHAQTPLHLAFSCYVFDADGRLLVTQRAFEKSTWPGAWTNTVCGHPAPGEGIVDAVRRRVRQELGIGLDDLRLVLPGYRYLAEMTNGTVENEMCPVFVAWTADSRCPTRPRSRRRSGFPGTGSGTGFWTARVTFRRGASTRSGRSADWAPNREAGRLRRRRTCHPQRGAARSSDAPNTLTCDL